MIDRLSFCAGAGPRGSRPASRCLASRSAAWGARFPIVGCAAALLLGAPAAFGQLALTTAGVNAGFQLTTFATGFPNIHNNGPLGMAFSGSGILVSDYLGNVRSFPTTADGQNAGSVNPAQNFGDANAEEIASVNGNYYMARRAQEDLVQLNPNGTLNQVIVSGLHALPDLYVCANPANGHLFVAGGTCHKIWDVDPVAKTYSVWLDNLPEPQQMTLSEDGQMLFVTQATNPGDVLGIDVMTKATIFDYATLNPTTPLNQPTGVAVGSGDLEPDLFVFCGDGTVWQIDRVDATATLLASGGTHGRAARGSINNSLLLAQTDRIMRLTAPAGSGFGYNSPGNFTAIATGEDRNALYWEGVPGAIGYNVYRGYVQGGEDYNAPPLNGSTLWKTHSPAGGNNYRYVDYGLFTGLEYFYTVKAVFPEGTSQPSDEASDVPYPGEVPWDSNSPADIVQAVRDVCNDGEVQIADRLRASTPDGLVYAQDTPGGPVQITAGGAWLPYTDVCRLADGTYSVIPDDHFGEGFMIQSLPKPKVFGKTDGPFRRVTSVSGYAGCGGQFYLPDDSNSLVARGPKGDQLYLYLGCGSDDGTKGVDAGLTKQWNHSGWTPFLNAKDFGKKKFWWLGGPEDIPGGQQMIVEFTARPANSANNLSKNLPCTLTVSDLNRMNPVTLAAPIGFATTGVTMKRVASLGQRGVTGFAKYGSYFLGAQFHGGQLFPYSSNPSVGDRAAWGPIPSYTQEEGSYPQEGVGGVIDWYVQNPYSDEENIKIDLRP